MKTPSTAQLLALARTALDAHTLGWRAPVVAEILADLAAGRQDPGALKYLRTALCPPAYDDTARSERAAEIAACEQFG